VSAQADGMAGSKHVRLSNRPERERVDARTAVSLSGRCRAGDREVRDVLVMDLGPHGCRLLGLSVGVTKSDPLELWLAEEGPFAARLKWVKRGSLGVEFDTPLEADVVERLANADPAPNVLPMRRSRAD
jgi:hypothetical protein